MTRAGHWTLIVRNGPRVERTRYETLGVALDAMEQRLDELAPDASRQGIQVLGRRYDAVRQVVVRAEISGPGGALARPHGGVDLRGDGSKEAYTGRYRRSLIELQGDETPYAALRRALGQASGE